MSVLLVFCVLMAAGILAAVLADYGPRWLDAIERWLS